MHYNFCKRICFRCDEFFLFRWRSVYLDSRSKCRVIVPVNYTAFSIGFARKIHFSSRNLVHYKARENQNAHKVLESIAAYAKTIVKHPTHHPLQKNPEIESKSIYGAFYKATEHNLDARFELGDPKFSELLQKLTKNFHRAVYIEIIHTLYCLAFWPSVSSDRGRECRKMLAALGNVCSHRLKTWTTGEKLLVADYWFHLDLSRFTPYNISMIRDLVQKSEVLSPHEVIQLLFFACVQRNVPQTLLSTLESKLITVVPTITIEELSIICLGYFKNECEIKNHNLLRVILDRAVAKMKDVDHIYVTSIIKCVRKSYKPHINGSYQKFMQACSDNCYKWDLYASIHAAMLSSTCMMFELPVINNAMEQLQRNLSSSRLKDIAKLLHCLAQFNYLPDSRFNDLLCNEVLKQDRHSEVLDHPHDFLNVALFYSYIGLYNFDILERVMSPGFIEKLPECEKMHFVFLDTSISIECENYVGPRLNANMRKHLMARLQREYTAENSVDGIVYKSTQNVLKSLKGLDGISNNVCVAQILPHMVTPDIIIRLKSTPSALPLPDIMKNIHPYETLEPPAEETWACLVIYGPYSYANNCDRICGLLGMKQRQLTKLGYQVLLLNASKIPKNSADRQTFLNARLNELKDCPLLSAVI